MRWCDERYVRVYTRDTGEWLALGWEAQALFLFALRKADRAGIVHAGKSRVRGLAGMTGMPLEVVERALPLLLDDGCLQETPGGYIIPNFIAAQETPISDAQRKRDQRERDRDKALALGSSGSKAGLDAEAQMSRRVVTQGGHVVGSRHDVTPHGHDMESRDVTSGHAGRVTPNCAVPSRADLSSSASRSADAEASGDGLPDATDHTQPADRPPLVLEVQDAHPPLEAPKPRRLSLAEELYAAIQRARRVRCEDAGEPYVDDRWEVKRMNSALKDVANGSEEDKSRFEGAFAEYLHDDRHAAKGWPLSLFMHGAMRSMYEKRALDAKRGAA